jgi:hypothetical protein
MSKSSQWVGTVQKVFLQSLSCQWVAAFHRSIVSCAGISRWTKIHELHEQGMGMKTSVVVEEHLISPIILVTVVLHRRARTIRSRL